MLPIDSFRFGDYLSGLTDGEGHFSAFIYDSREIRNGRMSVTPKTRLSFSICLRQDDLEVLKMAQDYLSCGRIEYRTKKVVQHNPTATFLVVKLDELAGCVIPHFDSHPLLAKKRRDYSIWREMVIVSRDVSKRKSRGRPDGRGHYQKWTRDEWRWFEDSCARLAGIRSYTESALDIDHDKCQREERNLLLWNDL